MIFTCYSELCVILEDCECGSDCCTGVKTKPLIIEYINDNEIKTNNPEIEYQVMNEDIVEMMIHHECPFCGNYVEA